MLELDQLESKVEVENAFSMHLSALFCGDHYGSFVQILESIGSCLPAVCRVGLDFYHTAGCSKWLAVFLDDHCLIVPGALLLVAFVALSIAISYFC